MQAAEEVEGRILHRQRHLKVVQVAEGKEESLSMVRRQILVSRRPVAVVAVVAATPLVALAVAVLSSFVF